jgi:hypothetical protein
MTEWFRIDDPEHPPPKDGTSVLVVAPDSDGVLRAWVADFTPGDEWVMDDAEGRWTYLDPTHWRPLPALPETP